MNMILVGYIMSIVNDQTFGESSGSYEDVAIKDGKLGYLATELNAERLFSLENFGETCFSRVGDLGKFLSPNLCSYIMHDTGVANDDGFILTIYYKTASTSEVDSKENAMLTDDKEEAAFNGNYDLQYFLDKIKGNRNKRSVVNKLIF